MPGTSSTPSPMSERQQLKLLRQLQTSQPKHGTPPRRSRSCNGRGETPLHKASIRGDLETVKRLLKEGADPNVPDFAGWTALHEACNHGWTEVAVALLDAGADVNVRGFDDDTPLHDAVGNGHAKLAEILLERGADLDVTNKRGKSPRDLPPARLLPHVLQPHPENLAVEKHLNLGGSGEIASADMKRTKVEKGPRVTLKLHHKIKRTGKLNFDHLPPLPVTMEEKASKEDVYEFKTSKEATPTRSPDADSNKSDKPAEVDTVNLGKRTATDNETDENEDDVKRKKKKEEGKAVTPAARLAAVRTASVKSQPAKAATPERKSPGSPKGAAASPAAATPKPDVDMEGDAPKVPPLKIVIPQSGQEPEQGARNGKSSCTRHSALPYVVSSSSNDSEKDESVDPAIGMLSAEDQNQKRVLRSAQRPSNSSPPAVSLPSANPSTSTPGENSPSGKSEKGGSGDSEPPATPPPLDLPLPNASTGSTKGSNPPTPGSTGGDEKPAEPVEPTPVDLHPRKRKMKHSGRELKEVAPVAHDDATTHTPALHPHEQPVSNCYQLFLDIRKQVARRRQGLFPVQPKPPQGFKDYLLNRCTYLLASNASTRQIPSSPLPANIQPGLREIFAEQEKERHRLRLQHVIEKEKLVLSVEQEILRVHGRAARALANQSVPFSVCTVLKDKEVYNLITPEQEEKDRNARSRYNGRLFLSWLQDVDDKWEKIKEHMLLRHHNEAESLHAVQCMNWEWKMLELGLCAYKSKPIIGDQNVPIVHVSDDFDLLPA